MKTFYLTFGQKYPWRNGWVEVLAPDMETAIDYVQGIFGIHYSNIYSEEQFDKTLFPAGKLGETIK